MQETSVQLVGRQIQALQTVQGAAEEMNAATGGMAVLDPFSAIILAMMQDGDGEASDAVTQIAGAKSQQDERVLAQNAAEFLLAGQAILPAVELPDEAGQETVNQVLSALTGLTAQTSLQQEGVPIQMQTVRTATVAPADQMQDAAVQESETAQPQITFSASMQQAQGDTPDSILQHSDRQLFEQVRARQNKGEGEPETQPLDIDALQAQADAQRPQVETQIRMQPVQEPKEEQSENISRQVTSQIQQNLERGSNEFTIRLKPKELGEVVVRLVEKEGKMTLQISAASEQTVKLLNGDLAALREAVRPMQVEVRDAVVQTQNTDGDHLSQSFDMGGHFFGNSQQNWEQNQTTRVYDRSGWGSEDVILADEEQIAQAARIVKENLLDVYL